MQPMLLTLLLAAVPAWPAPLQAPVEGCHAAACTSQAEVKISILDNLYRLLPRPPFTDHETGAIAARVYDYVWQRSASGQGLEAA